MRRKDPDRGIFRWGRRRSKIRSMRRAKMRWLARSDARAENATRPESAWGASYVGALVSSGDAERLRSGRDGR